MFTLLRSLPQIMRVPYSVPDKIKTLSRTDLGVLLHQLRRQVHDAKEARGGLTAAKRLFLVDLVLRQFDKGEVILSNGKAREYVAKALGKDIGSYHVAGKAARTFAASIEKILPNRFSFEPAPPHGVRVNWRPLSDPEGESEEFQFSGN